MDFKRSKKEYCFNIIMGCFFILISIYNIIKHRKLSYIIPLSLLIIFSILAIKGSSNNYLKEKYLSEELEWIK